MRRLILFRHAKSDWSANGAKDHERRLAPRGIVSAPLMAAWLHDKGLAPDHILCSTAERTRETLDLALTQWPDKPHVHYDKQLYLSSRDRIVSLIKAHGGGAETLMVIGHNPDMHDLALDLVGPKHEAEVAAQIGKYPTASMAVFKFEIDDWSEIAMGSGTLEVFRKPKDLSGQA
ncbi:MAG: SixA phosphatase family protein, partial [Hyphomicrobiaceae bacterium]